MKILIIALLVFLAKKKIIILPSFIKRLLDFKKKNE